VSLEFPLHTFLRGLGVRGGFLKFSEWLCAFADKVLVCVDGSNN